MIRDVTEGSAPLLGSDAQEIDPQALVRLYADDVWRYVSAKLRRHEDAEDATMETLAHAMQNFHKLRKVDSPKLWLLAVARNKVNDALRKRYRRSEAPLEESTGVALESVHPHREELQHALSDMPEAHREVLLLMYVNGLSTQEVALAIRKSESATNSLLQRARESLRQRMQHVIDTPGAN